MEARRAAVKPAGTRDWRPQATSGTAKPRRNRPSSGCGRSLGRSWGICWWGNRKAAGARSSITASA